MVCAAIKHSNPFLSPLLVLSFGSSSSSFEAEKKKKILVFYFFPPSWHVCFRRTLFHAGKRAVPLVLSGRKKKPKGRRDVEPRGSELFILLENFFLLPLKKFLPLRKEQLKTFSSRYVSRFFFRACVIRKPLAQGILIIILFLKKKTKRKWPYRQVEHRQSFGHGHPPLTAV